ncbi:MAG: 16S rRNA (guanine(527)-N(7))-methyltransferase RsmG [Burkholderiales bacterium]|nr:16S rRNA (guanine(527)-N(7))-methyltransferase RsmG [Burkholderiales bacterium]
MAMLSNRDEFSALLNEGAAKLTISLSARQIDKLLDYLALLVKWNSVYNLTSVRDPQQMVIQHLLDAMSALFAFKGAKRVLDVGTGGGLPGIVIAIWAMEAEPEMQVHLIDTVKKKTAFLTQVKAELGLEQVTVHSGHVEKLVSENTFDVITSRAFAELIDFVKLSGHLLEQDGSMIALKGKMPEEEIKRLPLAWRVEKVESLSVPGMQADRHLVWIKKNLVN